MACSWRALASSTGGKARADDGETGAGAVGSVELIVGPMFAGKTSELLRRMEGAEERGMRVAMIKSAVDDRYATDAVVSHDGARMRCVALPRLMDFFTMHGANGANGGQLPVDVVGVDEAQFFPDLVEFCAEAAHAGARVVVAGLDGDFRGRPFGQACALVPLADRVDKLAARCATCGAPAHFTKRLAQSDALELVGGAEAYAPACRAHHGSLDGGVGAS